MASATRDRVKPSRNRQGSQTLEILHLLDRQIPCIFLTDIIQPETVAELITEGAADCIGMDHVGHLPVAIRRTLNENNLRKERDQTEKRLRHSEARYRALVGNLNYGMCRSNAKGDFLDVNQTLMTMLGYPSRAELLVVNLATGILRDPSKRAQFLGQAVELDSADALEIEWKRKNAVGQRRRCYLSQRWQKGGFSAGRGRHAIVRDES
jgi:PAS domain S-box-containing protein